jgi:hypothetical protein
MSLAVRTSQSPSPSLAPLSGLTVARVDAAASYLWNFVTLPAFRGRGIYPRLLEAIIEAESVEAETFWIAYAPENHASAAGIHKAGFRTVGQLRYTETGQPAPCWRCMLGACQTGGCSCDYQRPAASCAGAA